MTAEMIRWLHRTILVRRLPMVDETPSGLILPAIAREKPAIGHIVAVGEKVRTLHVGDAIFFNRMHDRRLALPGDAETFLWFQEDEPWAVIEGL